MVIMTRKHYNEIINNIFDMGYKQGYAEGQQAVLLANLTPNEIRNILGLVPQIKEEKET